MTDSNRPVQHAPSCDDDYQPDTLSVDAAWDRILQDITPVRGVERLPTRAALGRILAEDIHSTVNVPNSDNSAMDGYALRSGDLPTEGDTRLRVVGTVLAGHPYDQPLLPGECLRIMTGAPMPAGADTVIPQEKVERQDDLIRIDSAHRAGQDVRAAGEDLAIGDRVLAAGSRVGVAELGMLGSLGLVEVSCRRRIRVAYFSTGDELRSAGSALRPGDVYDSNRYTLHAVLTELGVEATDMGVVPDEPAAMEQAFADAAGFADAILTSGGVSVGEADFVKDIMRRLGEVGFWKIAMRPGRPLAFGKIGRARFFGMPGNPVSVVATWCQFVKPALRHLMGQTIRRPLSFRVRAAHDLRKRRGRTEFQRGILERSADGELLVRTTGGQGSGILSSVSLANCFIVLPHDADSAAAGEFVEVQPFHGVMG
ncbi:molybdopterin-binding protein [Methylonatrum kenyense]|uniref:molybdopterin molybdotransferase MoeA n=1 Tax=Methylonatrum kenyense TaxID=455253 RepID=UPI0020BDF062|nr:gephyrin-like molybdotransferase Glp [Methylonatrum kenyense]MCK8514813.1 molybdopterin-binding protein [Methylonatrum kenyense]